MRRLKGLFGVAIVGLLTAFAGPPTAEPPADKSRVPASTVTLNGAPITLAKALQKLHKQTGNQVIDARPMLGQAVTDPDRTYPFRFDRKEFWPALEEIARQAKLSVYPQTAERGTVGLAKAAAGEMPVSYDGPFRVAVKSLAAHWDVAAGRNRLPTHLGVTVEITCEPRLRPIMLQAGPGGFQATSGAGQALTVTTGGRKTLRMVGEPAVELPLRVTPLPPRNEPALKELTGEFIVVVPPETAALEFANLRKGEQLKGVKGITGTLDEVRLSDDRWAVTVRLDYPAGALDLESHQAWAVETDASLKPKGVGEAVPLAGPAEVSVVDGGPIRVTYRFRGVKGRPEDFRLHAAVPAPPVRYPVRFRFTDVPLP